MQHSAKPNISTHLHLLLRKGLLRLALFSLARLRYPLRSQYPERFPAQGAVLLLGNHLSWIDWLILQLLSPRPICFVLPSASCELRSLRWLLRFCDFIPYAESETSRALAKVSARLQQGGVVCLFPEGAISSNGRLAALQRDWESAVAEVTTPLSIVPFHLRGLWGLPQLLSTQRLRWFGRQELRREIVLSIGAPLPITTTTAELRASIEALEQQAWLDYADLLPTLAEQWINAASRRGNPVALADTLGTRLQARQALTGSIVLARRISRLSPEPNIGLLLPGSAGGALCNLACLLAGKTAVNLNFTASSDALLSALLQAEIKTVYTSTRFLERLESRGVDLAALREYCRLVPLETLRAQTSTAEKLFTLLSCHLLPRSLLKRLYCRSHDNGQTAAILFSSGSEGAPKGVELSHRNLMVNIKQVVEALNLEADDVVLANLPTFHAIGLTVTLLLPLLENVPVVFHPDPTDVLGSAQAIAEHKVTLLCGTSSFFRLYNRHPKLQPLLLQSLRLAIAGAEKLQPEVALQFRERFGKEILEGYGATETAPVASVNLPDQLNPDTWLVQTSQRNGSVGQPLPGTRFRIVDPDSFTTLPSGTAGMILISGAQVMPHYLKNEAQTRKVLKELDGQRWYVSGDKGYLDPDGFLFIQDRYSRFAKIAGEMVGLGVVEAALRRVLADTFADTQTEILVVNLPDEKKGEKLVTLATSVLDPSALRPALLAQGLNALALPALYFRVEAIPRLGAGKTDFSGARQLALLLTAGHAGAESQT